MSSDEKMFELMTKMYGEMQKGFERVDSRIDKLESELKDVKKTVIKIEHDHGNKLAVLFDGYKQNSDKLDRIEAEVLKHDEFILRKIQ